MSNIGAAFHADVVAHILRENWEAASSDLDTMEMVRNAIESITRELGDHIQSSAAARLFKFVTTGEWGP